MTDASDLVGEKKRGGQRSGRARRTGAAEPIEPRINLGCGSDKMDDWHNVDIVPEADPDEVVDLNETPWPWPNSLFDEVLASNVLEHLDDQHAALHELRRITKPGGRIEVRVPHPNSPGFWADPTHVSPLCEQTFTHYLAPDWEVEEVRVSRVRFGRLFPESIALRLADHIGHVVDEITVVLRV
ncbi:class I SAM-dependent methyltransferase [Halopelagius fulvigenes]|uniref:Class I SAM-dependent methyltransferase n=1 Tax=Halopelagius fulvigenes TaxID=1198324 RepID=A0ABD5U6G0_9EURY